MNKKHTSVFSSYKGNVYSSLCIVFLLGEKKCILGYSDFVTHL